MRIAYLDCFAGISGDMFLGALVDAGVDPQVLHDATSAMDLGASLKIDKVGRSGISSTKVHVLEGGTLAETADHRHPEEQRPRATHSRHPETQHLHKAGHTHEEHTHAPGHDHKHGRSLTVIRQLIQNSKLAAPVIHTAVRAFELLGASEAKIHNVPMDDIHFHEVGAVDAIIDIVAASAGIHALGADKWVASPLNVGGGMVDCAHGRFPVPAPATADLLRGLPTYSANIQMELVTPTGAALIRTLVEEKGLTFGPQPAMLVERIGYGAGTRDPKDFPNVLRLSIGTEDRVPHLRDSFIVAKVGIERSETASDPTHHGRVPHPSQSHRDEWNVNPSSLTPNHHHTSQTVTVLETALDDLSPQLLAHVAETALQQGALDVMLTPVIMKKGRPGTLLTILCDPSERPRLEEFLLRETSTLGLRTREDQRVCLDRSFQTVQTSYGPIRMKLGTRDSETINANPEFEDCRAAAAAHGVPVKHVHQAAIAAYISKVQEKTSDG